MTKQATGSYQFFWFYIKLAILFIYIIYVLILFSVRVRTFTTDDPAPKVQPVLFEQRKEYSEFASLVRTGFFVKNFPTLDMSKNNFVVDATIWFEFYGSQLSLDVIDRFLFNNAKIVHKSSPDVRVIKDKLRVTYQVIIDLKSDLKFKSYPLTDHSVSIVLVNNAVTPSEMYFYDDEKHSFAVSDSLFDASWRVHSTKMQPGLISDAVGGEEVKRVAEYPCVAFTINFIKQSYKDLFVLFMPIFAALLFTWMSLLMNLNNEVGRFSLAITAVTALLGYRFVIEQMSPRDGSFTILDKFYLVFLLIAFLVFVFHLVMTGLLYAVDKARVESELEISDSRSAVKEIWITKSYLRLLQDIAFVLCSVCAYVLTLYLLFY